MPLGCWLKWRSYGCWGEWWIYGKSPLSLLPSARCVWLRMKQAHSAFYPQWGVFDWGWEGPLSLLPSVRHVRLRMRRPTQPPTLSEAYCLTYDETGPLSLLSDLSETCLTMMRQAHSASYPQWGVFDWWWWDETWPLRLQSGACLSLGTIGLTFITCKHNHNHGVTEWQGELTVNFVNGGHMDNV